MSNQQDVYALLFRLSGASRPIVIHPDLVHFMGGMPAAAFLSQLLFWSDKGADDGWFYKTYKEWEDETTLSEYLVRKYADACVEMGFLEKEVRKVAARKGDTAVHYRLDVGKFFEKLIESFSSRNLTTLGSVPQPHWGRYPKLFQFVYKETEDDNIDDSRDDILPIAKQSTDVAASREILSAYVDELGYKPSSYPREGKEAKQLAKDGYAPADVVAAYRILKAQPFWASKHLSLSVVRREIPALANYAKDGGDVHSAGKRMGGAEQAQAEGSKLQKRLRDAGLENLL